MTIAEGTRAERLQAGATMTIKFTAVSSGYRSGALYILGLQARGPNKEG